MKKGLILLPIVLIAIYFTLSSYSGGPSGNLTGAVGGSGCSCHGATSSGISVTVELDSAGLPVTHYSSGGSYTLKISATNNSFTGLNHFGFQVTSVKLSGAGTGSAVYAGTLASTGLPTSCSNVIAGTIHVVQHNARIAPTSGSGGIGTTYIESIPWTAPTSGTGKVVLYGVLNAVNTDFGTSGDHWNYASPDTISEFVPLAAITGTSTICVGGASTTLSDASTGGTWTSSNSAIATVGASTGIVSAGVTTGTATITYTVGTSFVTKSVVVNSGPGIIIGINTLCVASSPVSLSNITLGGSWSSTNLSVATINPLGQVIPVGVGNSTINYSTGVGLTCNSSLILTVNPLPAAITSTNSFVACLGIADTFNNTIIGGTWSSALPLIANISSQGVLLGVTTGIDTITYSTGYSTACQVSASVTVNTLPSAGTILGSPIVAVGSAVTFTDFDSGGIWSISNASIATVNTSGIVTGLSTGIVNLSYTVSNSCGSTVAVSDPLNVSALLTAGTIIGQDTVCIGVSNPFTDSVTGGVWSTSNGRVTLSTLTGTELVTGISSGIDTLIYTIGGAVSTYKIITISGEPTITPITGPSTICTGTTTSFFEATGGGIWNTTNGNATISSSGIVSASIIGTDSIQYSLSNICGTGSSFKIVTINSIPLIDSIIGTNNLCIGSTSTFTNSITGGIWSSSIPSIASVSSASGGIVTGLSAGLVTITYSDSNSCGSNYGVHLLNVSPAPVAGGIVTSTSTLCSGNTTTFTDSVVGGTWYASNSHAAISLGVVTGVSIGTDTIYYAVTNSCGTATVSALINITNTANPGTITGSSGICIGANTTLSDTVSGGIFATTNGLATVSPTGVVIGLFAGLDTVNYTVVTSCGVGVASKLITINPNPAPISGINQVCIANTISLSDISPGGTWVSSYPAIATISTSGMLSGLIAGVDTITYHVGGCSSSFIVSINTVPNPGSISGLSIVCIGSLITLSDSITLGGVWSASNLLANITPGGFVLGEVTGIDTILYTVSNSCGTATATHILTINPEFYLAGISGSSSVCQGSQITLSDSTTGGYWHGTNIIASVDSGVITGIATGIDTIEYSVTNSCGTRTVSKVISVNPSSSSGTILGPSVICIGAPSTFTESVTGGNWSTTNGLATVAGGIIYGISQGIDTIKYTISNSCGTSSSYRIITISALPNAGILTGTSLLCVGATTTLNDSVSGGEGTLANANVSVDSLGIATGISAGIDTIFYTVSNGCGSSTASLILTVNPIPNSGVISGLTNVCTGNTTTLTESVTGGIWSITNNNATISSGIVSGVSVGLDTIAYSVTNSCGTISTTTAIIVTNTANAGTISGSSSICTGFQTSLSNTISGGIWTAENTNATISSSGVLNGMVLGTDTVYYSITGSCGSAIASYPITINSTPGFISGVSSICFGNSATLSDITSAGTWSSNNPSIITVSGTGVIYCIGVGTAIISYTLGTGCSANLPITANPIPVAGTIAGSSQVCVGSTISLSDSSFGGTWSSSTGATSISSTGIVAGITIGLDTIKYTVVNTCGTGIATKVISVSPAGASAGSISGSTSICTGSIITYSDTISGGSWFSIRNNAIINSGGVLTAVGSGIDTIGYAINNSCGTTTATKIINISIFPMAGSIVGNSSICTGSTITLTDSSSSGLWYITNSRATIAAYAFGVLLTGNSLGFDTLVYVVANACGTDSISKSIHIISTPSAGTLSGSNSVCIGASDTLLKSVIGGTSTFTNTNAINSSPTGTEEVLTGLMAGKDTLIYTVTNICGSASVTFPITINTLPIIDSIIGLSIVCTGSTITLTDSISGGTWRNYNTNTHLSTIGISQIITGNQVGLDTILYKTTNSCGSDSVSKIITINPSPNAGIITGTDSICIGSTDSFNDTVSFGMWGISNGHGSILGLSNSATFTGLSAGIDTIIYTYTNPCGSASASKYIKIIPLPNAGFIVGKDSICISSPVIFLDSLANSIGYWSAINTNATVGVISGIVSGVATGIDSIKYTVSNYCGTATTTKGITILNLPNLGIIIATDTNLCIGSTISLTDSILAGTWSITNNHASISGNVLTGLSIGLDTVNYQVGNFCGITSVSKTIPILTLPDAGLIFGSNSICLGSSVTFIDSNSGGVWSTSNIHATISSLGILSAIAIGTDTAIYTVSNFCGNALSKKAITIITVPNVSPISGWDSVCIGDSILLYDSLLGGVWSANNNNVHINHSNGWVRGINYGWDTIQYKVTNMCGMDSTTHTIFVNQLLNPGVILPSVSGIDTICVSIPIVLTDSVLLGSWVSSNTHATVSGGIVLGATKGMDTILYQVSNSCGINFISHVIYVDSIPDKPIVSGLHLICVGRDADTLNANIPGGNWLATNLNATVINGLVSANASGSDTIIYVVTNSCSTNADSLILNIPTALQCDSILHVKTQEEATNINIYPNPSNGAFIVLLPKQITSGVLSVIDMFGNLLTNVNIIDNNKNIPIQLPQIAKGNYMLQIVTEEKTYHEKIVIW